ncbi:MAG: stage II sporulation protein R [Bacilli bacterium]
MKKIIIILFVLTIFLITINKENQVTIPNESIRYRIIANSNSSQDQKNKWEANTKITPIITDIMLKSSNIEETRTNIKKNINSMENELDKMNIDYTINYGYNYFPKKEYKEVIYNEGNYESLVITLGNGYGENWWCVLFPPLCLIDAKETDFSNVDYKFYINEILNKYHK